jgi:hypothetical protein
MPSRPLGYELTSDSLRSMPVPLQATTRRTSTPSRCVSRDRDSCAGFRSQIRLQAAPSKHSYRPPHGDVMRCCIGPQISAAGIPAASSAATVPEGRGSGRVCRGARSAGVTGRGVQENGRPRLPGLSTWTSPSPSGRPQLPSGAPPKSARAMITDGQAVCTHRRRGATLARAFTTAE